MSATGRKIDKDNIIFLSDDGSCVHTARQVYSMRRLGLVGWECRKHGCKRENYHRQSRLTHWPLGDLVMILKVYLIQYMVLIKLTSLRVKLLSGE